MPNDGARDVPDVAFAASDTVDPYLSCGPSINGVVTTFLGGSFSTAIPTGGTSAFTPSFAGGLALLVQKYGPLGNINPNLYAMAATSPGVFHDITSGNNFVSCVSLTTDRPVNGTLIGYSAGVGYPHHPSSTKRPRCRLPVRCHLAYRWAALILALARRPAAPHLMRTPFLPTHFAGHGYYFIRRFHNGHTDGSRHRFFHGHSNR